MSRVLNWGILSTANIGKQLVIPAIQQAAGCHVAALASRDLVRGQAMAEQLGIGKVYGSYEDLLADPSIDVIYNPLPNHLHTPWTIKALEAGKHVLCEKPIALTADEASQLIVARERSGKLVAEAFMVRFHPQWLRARELVRSGAIGEIRAIQSAFTYYNVNPGNVRNLADIGGGGLYDIGCYAIATARFIFEDEPEQVIAAIDRDPEFGTDRLSSALLTFPQNRQLNFFCSTQLARYQRVQICGTQGRIELPIPFNAPKDAPTRIFIDDCSDLAGSGMRIEEFPACNQYVQQVQAFAQAILANKPWPYPIEDAVNNMRVIDALFRSTQSGHWEKPAES